MLPNQKTEPTPEKRKPYVLVFSYPVTVKGLAALQLDSASKREVGYEFVNVVVVDNRYQVFYRLLKDSVSYSSFTEEEFLG